MPHHRGITRRTLFRSAGLGVLALALGRSAASHDIPHDRNHAESSLTAAAASIRIATPGASPGATPQPDLVHVIIEDLAFKPDEIEISAGTTVRWTNRDDFQHTVRSKDELFDSGIMEHGDTFEYTFDGAGVFDYICALHPSMKGRVTVSGSATPAATPDPSPSPAT